MENDFISNVIFARLKMFIPSKTLSLAKKPIDCSIAPLIFVLILISALNYARIIFSISLRENNFRKKVNWVYCNII